MHKSIEIKRGEGCPKKTPIQLLAMQKRRDNIFFLIAVQINDRLSVIIDIELTSDYYHEMLGV